MTLIALSAQCGTATGIPLSPVVVRQRHSSRRAFFEHHSGRQVNFRGVNVVYKDFPFYPDVPTFHSNLSFVEADAKLLRALGVNLIRLSVMWPGVSPEHPDDVNHTYVAEVKRKAQLAADHGIYVLLEPHQDELHPLYCGEGAPTWWTHSAVGPPAVFPVPVQSTPFKNSPPSRDDCNNHSSFSYIWSYDAARAYQQLYETSARPLVDSDNGHKEGPFARFWQHVVRDFAAKPFVLGGELWNEPFPGDVFGDVRNRNNKFADRHNLQPWYANLTRAIRNADDPSASGRPFLVAYEPSWPVGDQDIHPDSRLAPVSGFDGDGQHQSFFRDNIYAFHWYVAPCNPNLTEELEDRTRDADRLEAAPLSTEFNLDASDAASEVAMRQVLDNFEQRFQVSFTGWQYKSYSGSLPTGTCTGCGNSFYKEDGRLRFHFTRAFGGKPFARFVAGDADSVRSGEDSDAPASGPCVADAAAAAGARGDLVERSAAVASWVQAARTAGDVELLAGCSQSLHRWYELSFTVRDLHQAAAETEVALNELWLEADGIDHTQGIRQSATVSTTSSQGGGPAYILQLTERRPAEEIIADKVVIPASAVVKVAAAAPVPADALPYGVTVRLEFWARCKTQVLLA